MNNDNTLLQRLNQLRAAKTENGNNESNSNITIERQDNDGAVSPITGEDIGKMNEEEFDELLDGLLGIDGGRESAAPKKRTLSPFDLAVQKISNLGEEIYLKGVVMGSGESMYSYILSDETSQKLYFLTSSMCLKLYDAERGQVASLYSIQNIKNKPRFFYGLKCQKNCIYFQTVEDEGVGESMVKGLTWAFLSGDTGGGEAKGKHKFYRYDLITGEMDVQRRSFDEHSFKGQYYGGQLLK